MILNQITAAPFYHKKLFGHGGDTRGIHCVLTYDRAFEYPKFDTYKVSSTDLLNYEGVYGASDFPMELTIYKDGNELKAQGTGQPAFILKAVTKHQFAFAKAGL